MNISKVLDILTLLSLAILLTFIVAQESKAEPTVDMAGGRWYVVKEGVVLGSYYTATHTAYAAAITESFKCDCEIVIEQPDIKVNTSNIQDVVDPVVEVPEVLEDVRLSWNHPTARVGGEALPLDEIEGYGIIRNGTDVIVVTADSTEYIDVGLVQGTYSYAMYTITKDGQVSANTQTVEVVL